MVVVASCWGTSWAHKGAGRKEHIDLSFEQEHDFLDEIKLFIYGRIMCSMSAVLRYMDIKLILPQN
jgi:hypothetical protein